MRGMKAIGVAVAVLALAAPLAAQAQVGFEMRVGAIFSSGYNDTLDLVYEDVSGGLGWADIGFGVRVPVSPGFSIVPGVDLLVNFVTGGVDDGVNTIILPSVNAKYEFTEGMGFFVAGGVNYGVVNMGTDALDLIESDGIGFQASVGYQTAGSAYIELGFVQIPVAVEDFDGWDEDFGGVSIRGGFGF